MEIYLPIAEIPINILWLLLAGFFAGILSGLFGIGGGFIMTPLLIFMGVGPAIAVASSANQIIASSFSGFLTHARRKNVDFKMGNILIAGGFVGSSIGVLIFKFLKGFGQIDLVISLLYIFVLGFIGFSMAYESFKVVFKIKSQSMKLNRKDKLYNKLPCKIYFPRSDLTISLLIPVFVSIFSGILVSIMGIGGGFIMIPAMIYILGMPTSVVVGTSLFQVIFVTSNVTILHILTTQSVDIVLAGILLVSSVVGAQFGTRVALFCPAEKLRAILAIIILTLVFKLALGFFIAPINPFEVMLIDEN
ncbi:MAG: sulfite exporter TauE/SafE family protein [Rickettsiales bacterium]|nr:sulfite exporter TauE/SafE family protein [Rickettsiales bacterium]